jgi:hypothetical protein
MAINIAVVLAMARRLLGYRFSIAELIGIWFLVTFPYLLVGLFWSLNHTGHLSDMSGADKIVSFLGQIVSWPVLLFSDVCMT